MAKFDESRKVSMDDMEKTTGGSYRESLLDIEELAKRGFFSNSDHSMKKVEEAKNILHRLGYTRCYLSDEPNLNYDGENTYADKNGNIMSREQFWKDFDEEFI